MERPKGVFTADRPGALSLDQILAQATVDEQEEWEYEYSSTETETFYLTLELSYPEFKEASTKPHHHSRGGYYKNWHDEESSLGKAAPEQPPGQRSREDANDEGDGDEDNVDDDDNDERVVEERGDDSDDPPLDPALCETSYIKGKGKEKAPALKPKRQVNGRTDDETFGDAGKPFSQETVETHDIQILELHSPNPIISYRGRLFEGQWAEVIGTEVILTKRDHTKPLSALRNLPGDIDLLAASSSRILTTEKKPKARIPEQDTLADIKKEWNIRIPTGNHRTGERAEQTSFLENLIALKLKRGDKDHVTVYAIDAEGKDWDDRKALDYKPRRRRRNPSSAKKGKSVAGQPRGGTSMEKRLEKYPIGFGQTVPDFRGLSTPTPSHWEDISGNEHDDDDDDAEGGGDEGGMDIDDDGDDDQDGDATDIENQTT